MELFRATHRELREPGPRPGRARLPWALSVLAVLMLLASACSGNLRTGELEIYGVTTVKMPAFPETGANKVQLLTEMHYQHSYRSQEGPRLLPPFDSVPVTGREMRYATLDEYSPLTVPDHLDGSYDPARAQGLYNVNCQVCHGPTLRGQSEEDESARAKILGLWPRSDTGSLAGPTPVDLLSDIAKEATDGELFAFISKGGRQGLAATERGRESRSPMPEFVWLLTEEERWALVAYLRSQQGLR